MHRPSPGPSTPPPPPLGGGAVVTTVLVAGVGALALWQSMGPSSCSNELRLTVAAAPEIAPALRQAADRWVAHASAPGGQCIAVDVAAVGAADVALAIANGGGVALTGLTPLVAAGSVASATTPPASPAGSVSAASLPAP